MPVTRRLLIVTMIALPVLGTILRPALAGESDVYAPNGVAISGYDAVAYFTENRAVAGSASHALRWRGATWYFVSAGNMESFEMNPGAYAPQYGGYCAYSVAKGTAAPSSPEVYTIENGRLYLNASPAIRAVWTADMATFIHEADAKWPSILGR